MVTVGRGTAPGACIRPTQSPATAWFEPSRRWRTPITASCTSGWTGSSSVSADITATCVPRWKSRLQKARNREGDPAKFITRLESLTREEESQGAELRRKSQLKVNLRLLNLLVIHQPKLLLHTAVTSAGTASIVGRLEWVWDPLVEAIEAAVCPECGHPTFEFGVTRQGRLVCPACASEAIMTPRPTRR